jgi:glycosyltransferase involved in cell wall biosynthesis
LALLLATEHFEDFYGRHLGLSVETYLRDYRNDWSWDYARMLRDHGVQTLIYVASTEQGGRRETADGFGVRFLPLGPVYRPYVRFPALKRSPVGRYLAQVVNARAMLAPLRVGIREDDVDAVLIQEYWTGRFDVLVRALDVPVLAVDQGLPDRREVKLLKRRTMPLAYRVITQTERERAKVARFGARAERIPNAVDAERFAPGSPRQARESKLVLVASRLLDVQKRISDLLQAIALLPDDWRLRVLGNGPDDDRLRALARRLGIAHRVQFGGYVGDKDVIVGEMQRCSVFAIPSAYEGLPMALLEAMSTGAAVVGSDIPAIAEVVTHGRDGLLHAVGDATGLAQRLSEAEAARERLGAAARETILARYSQAIVGKQIAMLLGDAVGSNPATTHTIRQ